MIYSLISLAVRGFLLIPVGLIEAVSFTGYQQLKMPNMGGGNMKKIALVMFAMLMFGYSTSVQAQCTSASILEAWVRSRLSDDVIIMMLKSSPPCSTVDMASLKKVGAGEKLLAYLGAEKPPVDKDTAYYNLAMSQMVRMFDGEKTYEMKPAMFTDGKTAHSALNPISTVKTNVSLRFNGVADTRVINLSPAFEFSLHSSLVVGDHVKLVKFTMKDGMRQVEMLSANALNGIGIGKSSSGPSGKSLALATFEVITTVNLSGQKVNIYHLKPSQQLESGEYALLYNGNFYDFAIAAK